MAISRTARFTIRPDGLERSRRAIRDFVVAIREREPETLLYASFEAQNGSGQFLHVMTFVDEAAMDRHASSAWVRHFTDVIYPLTVDGVRFDDVADVATVARP